MTQSQQQQHSLLQPHIIATILNNTKSQQLYSELVQKKGYEQFVAHTQHHKWLPPHTTKLNETQFIQICQKLTFRSECHLIELFEALGILFFC